MYSASTRLATDLTFIIVHHRFLTPSSSPATASIDASLCDTFYTATQYTIANKAFHQARQDVVLSVSAVVCLHFADVHIWLLQLTNFNINAVKAEQQYLMAWSGVSADVLCQSTRLH